MPAYIKYIRFIVPATILLLCNTVLYAQEIKGKVIDAASGKPIAGANIYLNGTYQGTSSNSEGNFIIHSAERHIPLIVSYVGYESQTIDDYAGKSLTILLKRKANELKEVTIGFSAMGREEEMRIFLREFIGTSSHDCSISNPDDILFKYDKKARTLKASADAPLIIYNKKLGYKITYFLSSFTYLPMEVSFQGNYFFTEDTTGLKHGDVKKILKARDKVYYGSRMHFIRSLWANTFDVENFRVLDKQSNLLHYNDLITIHNGERLIKYYDYLRIDYENNITTLEQKSLNRETMIAENGFYDPNIMWAGDMGAQRVGEMLPFEFKPLGK